VRTLWRLLWPEGTAGGGRGKSFEIATFHGKRDGLGVNDNCEYREARCPQDAPHGVAQRVPRCLPRARSQANRPMNTGVSFLGLKRHLEPARCGIDAMHGTRARSTQSFAGPERSPQVDQALRSSGTLPLKLLGGVVDRRGT
jgi:hypothetical protein